MKKGIFWLNLLLILFSSGTGLAGAEDYRLKPGDIIDISVYGYPELQVKELPIRPDGKFSFPLVGELQAEGLSPAELSANLTKALAEYIKNPQVTINVLKVQGVRVYVLGEVNRPGAYEIQKQPNLLDAISMAGGYTRFAAKQSVYVIHKADGRCLKANLNNLLKKGDLAQNYELGDGDVVYLARNGVSFINDILPYIQAVYQIKIISDWSK